MARTWLVAALLLIVAGCESARPQTALERAELNLKSGEFDKAIEDCTNLVAVDPTNAQAFLLRGRAQQCAGRLDESLADLSKAIELNPDDSEAYYQRSDVYRALGKLDLKDKDDLAAREHDPVYRQSHLEQEDVLAADPSVRKSVPGVPMSEEDFLRDPTSDKQADIDLKGALPPDGLPPTKSVAETIFGPPPGPLDDDKPSKSRLPRGLEKPDAGGSALSGILDPNASKGDKLPKSPAGIATTPGPTAPGGGLAGKQKGATADKDAGGADAIGSPRNGRTGQVESRTKQRQIAAGQVVPGMNGDKDDYRRYLPTERSTRPYDANTMRSTGLQEFSPNAGVPPTAMGPQRIDPYGGLTAGKRPGQTTGQPGQGQGQSLGPSQGPANGPRPVGTSPYVPNPPGMRFDGGY